MTRQFRHRLLWLVLVTPIGFATKFYTGPAQQFVNTGLGGVLYEIFWCLLAGLFFAKTRPWKISLIVFLITSLLEVMQLWHPPFLEAIRSTFIGRTLIGTTFTMTDFPMYVAGSFLGYLLLVLTGRAGKG
ncbi:MAG: hypothetical protein Kow00127_12800 [Bacteroidales bacterium]